MREVWKKSIVSCLTGIENREMSQEANFLDSAVRVKTFANGVSVRLRTLARISRSASRLDFSECARKQGLVGVQPLTKRPEIIPVWNESQ